MCKYITYIFYIFLQNIYGYIKINIYKSNIFMGVYKYLYILEKYIKYINNIFIYSYEYI